MRANIAIEDLRVDCLIGCLARERLHPQTVRVDVDLDMPVDQAARQDRLGLTWDYAALARDLTFILQQGRFYLLEAAGRILLRYLLAPPGPGEERPRPLRARVTLTKFGVLPGEARPRVSLSASAWDLDFTREDNPWGTVDVLGETRLIGLYRLNIAPGAGIPEHFHRVMREAELVLGEGLIGWREGEAPRALRVGEVFEWPHRLPHGYRNETEGPLSLLCLDSPPFDPADEVETGA